jgi:hypothetical protein
MLRGNVVNAQTRSVMVDRDRAVTQLFWDGEAAA